jgi:hypothetical protein
MAKQIIKWAQVRPGDIISFRYKSKKVGRNLMQTIVVLNPRLPVKLKDGTARVQTIGLKLETSNMPTVKGKLRNTLLESMGEIQTVDEESSIYRVEISKSFILNARKGVKESFYKKIRPYVKKHDIYRIYDWEKLRATPIYLEPIRRLQ